MCKPVLTIFTGDRCTCGQFVTLSFGVLVKRIFGAKFLITHRTLEHLTTFFLMPMTHVPQPKLLPTFATLIVLLAMYCVIVLHCEVIHYKTVSSKHLICILASTCAYMNFVNIHMVCRSIIHVHVHQQLNEILQLILIDQEYFF